MRTVVLVGFVALNLSSLVSCQKADSSDVEVAPETPAKPAEAITADPPTSKKNPAEPPRVAPVVTAESVPPSPFLVPAAPTQQSTAEAFQTPPPVVTIPPLPPTTQPIPPPPRPWGNTTNNTGKPCPVGRCLLDGRCVKPGGPIANENDPPDVLPGVCGGDGGPCSRCRCLASGTMISTPNGEISIEDLRPEDRVWSVHQGQVRAVEILATQRLRVQNHSMARIQFPDGFFVEISGEHPTGDGRALWALNPGDTVGNAQVQALTVVPYEGGFTFDILPDSDTGTYFVHGMWLGSTMFGQKVRGQITAIAP
jgi:hypothetical protein